MSTSNLLVRLPMYPHLGIKPFVVHQSSLTLDHFSKIRSNRKYIGHSILQLSEPYAKHDNYHLSGLRR